MNPNLGYWLIRFYSLVLVWWVNRVGVKGVLWMLGAGTILAIFLNYRF